jgi:hypothetical protein
MPSAWEYQSVNGEIILRPVSKVDPENELYIAGRLSILLPEVFMLSYGAQGMFGLRSAGNDVLGEVRSTLNLCEALSCSNVKADTLQFENKKANIKREKKGKLPIYETKVLTIESPMSSRTGLDGFGCSDRKSPRQHLRRGHIRRISDNRKIWVNSCVVGTADGGRIDKSYRVVGGLKCTEV